MDVFRETLLDKDLSNNTVNKQMILMKKLLDIAVKEVFLNENPYSQIKRLPVPKDKMNYWTVKEFKQFLEPDDSSYKLMFKVLFSTGMRIGELLGLTWKDIDFSRKEIDVNKTHIHLPRRTILNEPKTAASKRKITIQSNLVDEFQSWKETQTARLSRFTDDVEQLQVFQFAPSIITRYMVTNKFNAILEERTTELKRIRIHDFRHSHVALLIENGEKELPIKQRLGHAYVQTTYDTYGRSIQVYRKACQTS